MGGLHEVSIPVNLSRGGVWKLIHSLQGMGIGQPIESYSTHYAAVATDMATGREIWLQSGPIHEAVRASIAIPGIFSPARLDDSSVPVRDTEPLARRQRSEHHGGRDLLYWEPQERLDQPA